MVCRKILIALKMKLRSGYQYSFTDDSVGYSQTIEDCDESIIQPVDSGSKQNSTPVRKAHFSKILFLVENFKMFSTRLASSSFRCLKFVIVQFYRFGSKFLVVIACLIVIIYFCIRIFESPQTKFLNSTIHVTGSNTTTSTSTTSTTAAHTTITTTTNDPWDPILPPYNKI